MAVLLFTLLFLSIGAVADKARLLSYDENVAAQYIWVAQILNLESLDMIRNWTCGLACDTVTQVHNVHVTQHGFPLQTMGMVAQYGRDDCILGFRGSKTLLNYLLDDFNLAWTQPYAACPKCRVHAGFYKSWQSLKEQTLRDIVASGCENKPIRVMGHSMGAAIAAIASFELVQNYTLKHVYTFGQPRAANQDWVEAFQQRMAIVPYFRVVDYMDAVPHLPPKGFVDTSDDFHASLGGYLHPGPEIFCNATRRGSYRACAGGEDPKCSDQYNVAECLQHTCCHCSYLGMNPCDLNDPKPQCIQPKTIRMTTESTGEVVV